MTNELTIDSLQAEIDRIHAILKIQHGGLVVAYAEGEDEYSADGEPQVRIADDQVAEVHPISRAVDALRDWAGSWIDGMEADEAEREIQAVVEDADYEHASPIQKIRRTVRAKWDAIRAEVSRGR